MDDDSQAVYYSILSNKQYCLAQLLEHGINTAMVMGSIQVRRTYARLL